jgi:hypothetical protein
VSEFRKEFEDNLKEGRWLRFIAWVQMSTGGLIVIRFLSFVVPRPCFVEPSVFFLEHVSAS